MIRHQFTYACDLCDEEVVADRRDLTSDSDCGQPKIPAGWTQLVHSVQGVGFDCAGYPTTIKRILICPAHRLREVDFGSAFDAAAKQAGFVTSDLCG